MNFVMSVEFSNGSTRVSVRAEDRSGATFLYRNGLFVSDPVGNLFGPASGSCQSLAELFAALSRRLAILSNLLPGHDKASGPGEDLTILGQSQPSGSDNPVAMLAQLDVTTVFVPFGDLAARAALAGPLDTDPAEGGVLPTMDNLTPAQLGKFAAELGADIMDPSRKLQLVLVFGSTEPLTVRDSQGDLVRVSIPGITT